MSWLSRLFGSAPPAPEAVIEIPESAEAKDTALPELHELTTTELNKFDQLQQFKIEQAGRLMEIINESLQLSNNSVKPDTKVSRLELARARLDELVELAARNTFIKLLRLDGVRESINALTNEYQAAGYYAQADSSQIDYSRNGNTPVIPNADLLDGWNFCATIQMRVPHRILSRHGEKHRGPIEERPVIEHDQSQGYWADNVKTWEELGIPGVPNFVSSEMASEIGPIPLDGGDYLKFLLVVRLIVERPTSVDRRIRALKHEMAREQWREFVRLTGGTERTVSRFFPAFINLIKGLPITAVGVLWDMNLVTANQLMQSSDATLLSVKGIGPSKLKAIREACEAAIEKDSDRLDCVIY